MLILATGFVVLMGLMMIAAGVAGVIRPDRLTDTILKVFRGKYGVAIAVGVRVLLGLAMIISAPVSTFPAAFTVLGWLVLLGAIVVLVARARIDGLIGWIRNNLGFARAAYLFGALFGGFLVYCAIPANIGA